MSPHRSHAALALALLLATASCGSDNSSDLDQTTQTETTQPQTTQPEASVPAEPDGGIGDGAEPLPGAEDPVDKGTWHGEEVAVTNCPDMKWKRVQASEFSFSVPADFVESDVQGIDSEVGVWTGGNNIEVNFDYGWYSGSISDVAGAETEPILYSGIGGEQTIVRDTSQTFVEVYFDNVKEVDDAINKLTMLVRFPDPNDEIIGRCIVGSISWSSS